MSRRPAEGLKAITANRLGDGGVVWLGPAGDWVERLEAAALFAEGEAEAALEGVKQRPDRRFWIDPYLIEVALEAGAIRPLRYREAVRALGPSVRLDLGKQADAGSPDVRRKEVA